MNRREIMLNRRHKRSTALERSVKYFTGGLKVAKTQSTHILLINVTIVHIEYISIGTSGWGNGILPGINLHYFVSGIHHYTTTPI